MSGTSQEGPGSLSLTQQFALQNPGVAREADEVWRALTRVAAQELAREVEAAAQQLRVCVVDTALLLQIQEAPDMMSLFASIARRLEATLRELFTFTQSEPGSHTKRAQAHDDRQQFEQQYKWLLILLDLRQLYEEIFDIIADPAGFNASELYERIIVRFGIMLHQLGVHAPSDEACAALKQGIATAVATQAHPPQG